MQKQTSPIVVIPYRSSKDPYDNSKYHKIFNCYELSGRTLVKDHHIVLINM